MKKVTKKLLSLILAIVFLFSFATIAYADEVQPCITFVASLQVISAPISGSIGSAGISGHSFIVVKNTSNSTITVGHMPVSAGDSVTVGTFGNRNAHKGIWYNIEGYSKPKGASYGLQTGLTLNDLNTINTVINNNDNWTLTNNCSIFAKKVWNAVYPSKALTGTDPLTLSNSIKSKEYWIADPAVPSKTKDKIARHTSTGYVYDTSGATHS